MVRVLLWTLFLAAAPAFAQDGRLDPDFGGTGIVRLAFGVTSTTNDVAVLADGGILVAGTLNDAAVVYKFNLAGTLDSSFGTGGVADMGTGPETEATALVARPDGRIDVTVHRRGLFTAGRATIVRLLPAGNRDVSFGTDGAVPTYRTRPIAAVLDSAGRTIVLGYEGDISTASFLYRVNPDGTLDAQYGNEGVVTLFDVAQTRMSALALDSAGRALLAGRIGPGVPDIQGAIIRVTPAGSLDETFGNEGIARPISGDREYSGFGAIQVGADGQIWAAGTAEARGLSRAAVVRMDSNGDGDPGFGTDGLVLFDDGFRQSSARALRIQPDGNVLIVGFDDGPQGNFSPMVARLLLTGDRDPTFGNAGISRLPSSSADFEDAVAMDLGADGSVALVGNRYITTDADPQLRPDRLLVARLLNDFLVSNSAGATDGFVLSHSGPNPSAIGRVALRLNVPQTVLVTAYDALGRAVGVLHNGPLGAGEHAFRLGDLAPGAYLVRAVATDGAAAVLSATVSR